MEEVGCRGRADARPLLLHGETHRKTESMDLRHPNEITNEERRRAERPVWRRGVLISVLLHLVLLFS